MCKEFPRHSHHLPQGSRPVPHDKLVSCSEEDSLELLEEVAEDGGGGQEEWCYGIGHCQALLWFPYGFKGIGQVQGGHGICLRDFFMMRASIALCMTAAVRIRPSLINCAVYSLLVELFMNCLKTVCFPSRACAADISRDGSCML